MHRIFLIAGLFLLPALAPAQVTINQAALVQLAGIQPAAPVIASPPPPPVRHIIHHHRLILAIAKPAPPPVLPAVVHPKPVPSGVVPAPKPVPVVVHPPPPIALTFAPGSADLPAGTTSALKPYCSATTRIGINARAPGDASDPSIAMRLSLARAFAVRDALVACGVPSQNILPRALGTIPGANEDETLLGTAP